MAWIKLHDTARTNHKIAELAKELRVSHAQALGHLAMLWLARIKDGDLAGYTTSDIAWAAGWRTDSRDFVAALVECRLIEARGKRYVIHDWADYRGSLAEAQRKARSRAAKRKTVPGQSGMSRDKDRKRSQDKAVLSRDNAAGSLSGEKARFHRHKPASRDKPFLFPEAVDSYAGTYTTCPGSGLEGAGTAVPGAQSIIGEMSHAQRQLFFRVASAVLKCSSRSIGYSGQGSATGGRVPWTGDASD